MKIVLMEKLQENGGEDLSEFKRAATELSRGLNVNVKVTGLRRGGLPEMEVEGEDQEILVNMLNEKWCVAPIKLSEVKVNRILKGFVAAKRPAEEGLSVDVGLRIPKYVNALYPSSSIVSQLGDGQRLSTKEIVEHFCLVEGLPVETIVTNIRSGEMEVDLSSRQIEYLWSLDSDPSHKLVVTGCLRGKLEKTLHRPGVSRLIFKSVPLALKVHLLYCVFGVDADIVRGKIEKAAECSVSSFKPSLRRMRVDC